MTNGTSMATNCLLKPQRSIDEKHGVHKTEGLVSPRELHAVLETSETSCFSFNSLKRDLKDRCFARLSVLHGGIRLFWVDSCIQPVPLVIDLDHCLVNRTVIRILLFLGL